MAKGKDESNNPRRRPQRPQTDEEKMAIVKQVFPNAQEVEGPRDFTDEEEAEADRLWEEYSQGFSEHESSRAEKDAVKESFGDDYNAYKAHEAGNIEKDED